MNKWVVYRHTSPSGKVYIGITSNLKNRWNSRGRKYYVHNSIFKNAIEKYGWDNIQHEVLFENVSKEEAIYAEKYLIRWYKIHGLSYNITDGGEGTLGRKFSEESIQKIKNAKVANNDNIYLIIDKKFNYKAFTTLVEAANFIGVKRLNVSHVLSQPIGYTCKGYYVWKHKKNNVIDIEDIKSQILSAKERRHKKASEALKTRVPQLIASSKAAIARMTSEERKAKYATYGMRGKHHSEQTKKKMSETAIGRDMSKAIEARKRFPYAPTYTKPVIQYLITGELVREFSSIKQASMDTKISRTGIANCLKGRSNTSGGYKWQYKN